MNICKNIAVFLAIGLISCAQQKENQKFSIIDPEAFGLESISMGYDSLQIRIWYIPPMAPLEIFVVTIKRRADEWTGTIRNVHMNFVNDTSRTASKDDMILVPFKIKFKDLLPKSDWNNILRKMKAVKLFSLPDMSEIPNLEDGVIDGDSYIVEIATTNEYRTYSYHVPDYFADKYWQAQNMVNILDLIDSELGMPWNRERDYWRIERMREELNRTADSVIIGEINVALPPIK